MKNNYDKELKQIIKKIEKTVNPQKIILFGSHASGKNTSESDVDLCVIINDDKNKIETVWNIREAIFDIITIPVDLLVFNKSEFKDKKELKTTIENQINKNGKVLYG